jgi:hypothetical protein
MSSSLYDSFTAVIILLTPSSQYTSLAITLSNPRPPIITLPAMLTIDPPILSLVPHLILTIDGGNKSIRFVSDQGDDHRVEVEEEHYEVEP